MAPRATRDLGQFGGRKLTVMAAVEFAALGEGHMVDIHVQTHTNSVGGDQKIDLAGLIHFDLSVSGARAQAAHNNGGPAALLAHDLGNGIDIIG